MKKQLKLSEKNIHNLSVPVERRLEDIVPIVEYRYQCKCGVFSIYNQGFDRSVFCISFEYYHGNADDLSKQYSLFKCGKLSYKWLTLNEMIGLSARNRTKMFGFNSLEEARKFMLDNFKNDTDPKKQKMSKKV